MAGERLPYWEYVKAAFWKPVRSRVLGAMPLTQMLLTVFGLAGFVNPGFWFLGLATFVAFVGGRSASDRFQRLVDAERLLARQGSAEDRMKAAYDRLDVSSRGRYRALVLLCREILGLGPGESGLTDFRAGNLNQLLALFLRLLASREGIIDTLRRVDRTALEADLESLTTRLAAAGDPESPLARSLKATLQIQQKRLANLDTAAGNLAVVDAELERIEQQVRLVREESVVSRSPEAISARLDAVSRTLGETSRFLDQHAELFSDISVSDFEAGSVPPLSRAVADEQDEETPHAPAPRPKTIQRQR
ncbi:MAG TPA: hypothetical protein VLK65_28270 [Vicinamibacteria bacterium]|nr:hypothetical protein [Vicinamibacteria bacterium]